MLSSITLLTVLASHRTPLPDSTLDVEFVISLLLLLCLKVMSFSRPNRRC